MGHNYINQNHLKLISEMRHGRYDQNNLKWKKVCMRLQ